MTENMRIQPAATADPINDFPRGWSFRHPQVAIEHAAELFSVTNQIAAQQENSRATIQEQPVCAVAVRQKLGHRPG
jgi:hypothetical protein